ncbi:hypothetical protein PYW07_011228 [Mythimna separata]|uniref:EGF-like domain-containing protein n=1 Tax=Mythimna separata TaxID=271217 RepID=A0AAD7Y7I3_MYTSE|nr:hypothetical protein PYW07_011228 [Mythimna separata]
MQCKFIFASIVLLVGHVHSFPWDIVVSSGKQLEFYFSGTLTHTEIIPSAHEIHSVTYDPVQYRVLFVNRNTDNLIYSFDISTKKTQHLITRTWDRHYLRVVYDPVTQALYWRAGGGIYTYSLNPAASNKEVDGKLLIPLDHIAMDLAVDSCGRYIYWITDKNIERARLDGSEREVLIDYAVYERRSLAIDQKTQKIYWTERHSISDNQAYIESANFNGKNRTTLYIVRDDTMVNSLAVTKDAIYWHNYYQGGIWQLSKNQKPLQATKLYSLSTTACGACQQIAANYTLKEQTEGIKSCDALRGLIPNDSKSTSTVSICQYYCFQGECSVSAEGRPTCSCKAGYSGERCEVNCHDYCLHGAVCSLNEENKRVCQCTSGYEGDRCDVSICKDYCFQGNCSVAAEGQPKCSCEPGHSGKRCEVSACKNHCLNNGVCSLNEDGEPVCECTSGYEGERCDVSICKDYCLQGNCSLDAVGLPKCSCLIGYSGVRCEVNACHEYCLNGGVCSLNEEDEPSCQCTADYDGVRCEVSAYKDNSCEAGSTGEGKVSACHQFCLNDGVCSLNEASEPVCQCTADYAGDRCDIPAFMAKWVLHAYKDVAPVTRSDAVKSTCASTVV